MIIWPTYNIPGAGKVREPRVKESRETQGTDKLGRITMEWTL